MDNDAMSLFVTSDDSDYSGRVFTLLSSSLVSIFSNSDYDVVRGATSTSSVRIHTNIKQQRKNVDRVGLYGGMQSVLEDPGHYSHIHSRRTRTIALSTARREAVLAAGTRRQRL